MNALYPKAITAAYTAGPWQISRSKAGKNGTSLFIWRNDEGPNSSEETNTNWSWIAQHIHSEADARLIAAAPDLLCIVERVAALQDHSAPRGYSAGEWAKFLRSARAAISKAEGGDA